MSLLFLAQSQERWKFNSFPRCWKCFRNFSPKLPSRSSIKQRNRKGSFDFYKIFDHFFNFLYYHGLVKTNDSQPQKGKWQSFTAAFGKMMKPAYDDLFVNFNPQAPTLVKFQFYRALQNILITEPNWSVLSSALNIMLEKPAHSITQERVLN